MRKKRLIVAAYLLLCGLIVVFGIVHFVASPSEGTLAPVKQAAAPKPVSQVTVNNAYGSFSYPDNFTKANTDKPTAPILEHYSFINHSVSSWELAVQYTRLADGSLDSDGSYIYRSRAAERFTHTTRVINGITAVVFTDNSAPSYAKTAFVQNGNTDIVITLSSPTSAESDALQAVFSQVVGSVKWQSN